MANTPSIGVDQNKGDRYIDKYWGRVPQFLRLVPESFVCEANPEYLILMAMYIDGTLIESNVEPALYAEIENIMINLACPCLLTGKDRAIMNAFLGNETCPPPSHMMTCGDSLCCNSWVMCKSPTLCEGP